MIKPPSNVIPDGRIEGVLDKLVGNTLHGWAWAADREDLAVRLEVLCEGNLLAAGEASTYRADLAAAGKRSGRCGFAIVLDKLPDAGSVLTVNAVSNGVAREISGSPLAIPMLASTESAVSDDVLPIPIGTQQFQGSLDQCGPNRARGWIRSIDGTQRPPTLALNEGAHEWMRFDADHWRPDLAEIHQDDGCCGFDVTLPEGLRDGLLHKLELRIAGTAESALGRPFHVQIHELSATSVNAAKRQPAALTRPVMPGRITLSIIVNFYNMRREAQRTLTSLGLDYQRGADGLEYEVICVDNGSSPPLEAEWIASFGPQFRLFRPSRQLSSPCAALNEAALEARGRYLALMIDGAHLLTPGVFSEALLAWKHHENAVVAVRHWFVGGDQRWLAMVGYTGRQEDELFDRIRWPSDGYGLFRIGAPIGETAEPWFDDLTESNCLMLPATLYDRIGGFDEAFDQAGGGFANLDLWTRAAGSADAPLISLVGEASFHQFHGGTTTNVGDSEKDLRVRSYSNAYRETRGKDFVGVHRSLLSFQGRMRSEFATGVRQRSLMPMRLGVTDRARPGQLAMHLDDGAQTYLHSVYAECGLQHEVNWLGEPVGVAPADLISMQEIIHQLRPDAIVAVGVERGLITFIDSVLHATNNDGARLLDVQAIHAATQTRGRVTALDGPANDPAVLATVRHWIGSAETVLVLFTAGTGDVFSVESLKAYAALVSYHSYLICPGTLFGQPWLGYSTRQYLQTIREFIRDDSSFVIDRGWNRQLVSTCPSGYLRRVRGASTAANYDASLDDFSFAPPELLELPQ